MCGESEQPTAHQNRRASRALSDCAHTTLPRSRFGSSTSFIGLGAQEIRREPMRKYRTPSYKKRKRAMRIAGGAEQAFASELNPRTSMFFLCSSIRRSAVAERCGEVPSATFSHATAFDCNLLLIGPQLRELARLACLADVVDEVSHQEKVNLHADYRRNVLQRFVWRISAATNDRAAV